jgi:hypothetical protein
MRGIEVSGISGPVRFGPGYVPSDVPVRLGRATRRGIRLDDPHAPRDLATLQPMDGDWLLRLGPSGAAAVDNVWVKATFASGAVLGLPRGVTDVHWPGFNTEIRLRLHVGASGKGLPRLGSDPEQLDPGRYAGTLFEPVHAGRPLTLTERQRRVAALTFQHLLDPAKPRPRNLLQAAALAVGNDESRTVSEAAVKQVLYRIRDRVNDGRGNPFTGLDPLGEYLVIQAGLITDDDLPFLVP